MEKIEIGKIVSAVGISGEVKVYNYSDYKERFSELKYIYLQGSDEKVKIKSVRYIKNMVILKLQAINDRNMAESMRNTLLYIDSEQLRQLPADTYYIKDMMGMQVKTITGEFVGILCDVIKGSAQDLYEVEMPNGKKTLIPAVSEFIKNIDQDKKVIEVELIDGLLDL
ncbi:MAG: ribosome maturation factor RimM [Eubacteriales bacterium]